MRFVDWEFRVGDVLAKIGSDGKWVVSGTDSIDRYYLSLILEDFGNFLEEPLPFHKTGCEQDFVKIGIFNFHDKEAHHA